jgi:hypothetical protein
MPNIDLINKEFVVTDESAKNYLGDKITGNNLTTIKSRLENKPNLNKDEENALKWVTKKYEEERNKIDSVKRSKMNIGMDNQYKKTHTKDKYNANPTKIGGLAKLTSNGEHSKASDQVYNSRVQYYESIENEVKEIKRLIEYLLKDNK